MHVSSCGATALNGEADDELVGRSARGDRLAFALLVERHERRVLAVAARICGDRSTAEDIVQEVFTRAWIKAPTWRPGGRATYATWLCRIAVNLAIDLRRRKQHVSLDDIGDPADGQVSNDEKLIDAERHALLERAVALLPERQRVAIALTYDAGLSNAEAARTLSTTIGAVELLLVRARRALREAMMRVEQ